MHKIAMFSCKSNPSSYHRRCYEKSTSYIANSVTHWCNMNSNAIFLPYAKNYHVWHYLTIKPFRCCFQATAGVHINPQKIRVWELNSQTFPHSNSSYIFIHGSIHKESGREREGRNNNIRIAGIISLNAYLSHLLYGNFYCCYWGFLFVSLSFSLSLFHFEILFFTKLYFWNRAGEFKCSCLYGQSSTWRPVHTLIFIFERNRTTMRIMGKSWPCSCDSIR